MDAFHLMIGERIALARKERGLRQEELSDRLGFNDRQILSNIESGKRRVTSEELVQLMGLLGKPLEYFTDPTLVVGEGIMSWRADAESAEMEPFESWALGIVGTHRQLRKQLQDKTSPLRMFLPLDRNSTFEAAAKAGEDLVTLWGIAPVPAEYLQEKIENELDVLVLAVDAPDAVSGGAINVSESAAIFINRKHGRGRRNFTLAHELFHVLTWHTMPPNKIDPEPKNEGGKRPRAELLADNFAAAVLMPFSILADKLQEWRNTTALPSRQTAAQSPPKTWFRQTAEFFQVSIAALKYRLMNAKLVLKEALDGQDLDAHEETSPCLPFGRLLLDRLNRGIDSGFISARRAASLLKTSLDNLGAMICSHGLEPAFSL